MAKLRLENGSVRAVPAAFRSDRARMIAFDISMTLASIAVLLIAALYVVAPPVDSMAVEISQSAAAADSIVVYGTITDSEDKPVRSATLVVSRQDGGTLTRVATVPVAPDGTFNASIPAIAGTYRLVASVDVGGTVVRDTVTMQMVPGTAYGIAIELVQRDYFLFLPIGSY